MKICDKIMLVGITVATVSVLSCSVLIFLKMGFKIMEITVAGTIIVAVLSLLATIITLLVKVRVDSKSLTEIKDNTRNSPLVFDNVKNSPKTYENTEKIKDVLNEKIKPDLNKVIEKSDLIDFLADEIRYQKRIKDSISPELQQPDNLIQQINALCEKNVTLQKSVEKYSAECLKLTSEKLTLISKIEKLQTENKNLREQIESEYSESEIEY